MNSSIAAESAWPHSTTLSVSELFLSFYFNSRYLWIFSRGRVFWVSACNLSMCYWLSSPSGCSYCSSVSAFLMSCSLCDDTASTNLFIFCWMIYSFCFMQIINISIPTLKPSPFPCPPFKKSTMLRIKLGVVWYVEMKNTIWWNDNNLTAFG